MLWSGRGGQQGREPTGLQGPEPALKVEESRSVGTPHRLSENIVPLFWAKSVCVRVPMCVDIDLKLKLEGVRL